MDRLKRIAAGIACCAAMPLQAAQIFVGEDEFNVYMTADKQDPYVYTFEGQTEKAFDAAIALGNAFQSGDFAKPAEILVLDGKSTGWGFFPFYGFFDPLYFQGLDGDLILSAWMPENASVTPVPLPAPLAGFGIFLFWLISRRVKNGFA